MNAMGISRVALSRHYFTFVNMPSMIVCFNWIGGINHRNLALHYNIDTTFFQGIFREAFLVLCHVRGASFIALFL
jgi:hypothetical protein